MPPAKDVEITYGRELGVDLKMLRAAGDRIQQAIDASPRSTVPRHETLLVVVGRGASDPDANSNVAKVMRLLWEGMGFGWGEVAYSGVTFPLVAPALDHAVKLGYRRIIVFPYFLFTGVLVKRIYDAAAEARARYPGIEFLNAPYLNDHPLVVDTFVDRIQEMLVGAEPDELRHVQVPRAGAGLRGRGRPEAGEPPPSCRGYRRRAGKLPLQGRLRFILPRRGLLPEARPALDAAPYPRSWP
jgi:hypothetical protein